MPPYNTDDLISEVLANLAAQRQSPPEQSVLGARMTLNNPQNQSDPMTDATLEGLRQNGGNIPQQQPILNGLERQYASKLLGPKIAYAAAQNDAQRQEASMNANMLRQAAQGAGMDLSGYGSDVSLQDAMQNLQTNDARALVEIFQGKYSKSSDQFFNDKWNELIKSGMPVGRAQRAAGELARQYQGERVSYLNGMLHGYGFDGRVVTPVGQEMIRQIALEDPQSADMYLKVNPQQTDAYQQESSLANSLALAALQQNNELARMAVAFGYNTQLADQAAANTRQTYAQNQDVDYNKWRQQEIDKRNWADEDFTKNFERGYNLVLKHLGEKAGTKFAQKYFGILQTDGKDAETQRKYIKDTLDSLHDTQKQITDRRKELLAPYTKEGVLLEIPDEVKAQLVDLDEEWNTAQQTINGLMGVSTAGDLSFEAYSGDETKDVENARRMLSTIMADAKKRGQTLTEQATFETIRDWIRATDPEITEHYIQGFVDKVKNSR